MIFLRYCKNLKPKEGKIYFSDYALIHNTFRNPNCGTRVSIDTTLFVGQHKPHKDRLKEYRNTIPEIGINEFIGVLHKNQKHYQTLVRWSKGVDIDAACGQLSTNTL